MNVMFSKLTLFILFYFAVGSDSFIFSAIPIQRDEMVNAIIVAYSVEYAPACHDVCYGSLIARINQPDTPARYIEVIVGYRPGESQFRFINRKRSLRLRVSRNKFHGAAQLREFIRTVSAETDQESASHQPAWKLIPGAEDERLPYGIMMPSYFLQWDFAKLIKKLR
jgi:hypothetical protein